MTPAELCGPGARGRRERPARFAVGAVLFLATAAAACDGPGPRSLRGETYPRSSVGGDATTYELGPGGLETTGDTPWDGGSYIVYPVVLDTDNHPVEVEVRGLDLSGIEYMGDLGWPPDGADTGALFQASLIGSAQVSMRVYSNLSMFEPVGTLDHRDGLRAFQFSGFNGTQGPYGLHQLDLEQWSPGDAGTSYDTFDLRFRYRDGMVESWVRMHASRDWDEGERESGAACPTNVAINNAASGTEDQVWTGECTPPGPGASGLAVGAWVPVDGGPWYVSDPPGAARVSLYLGNWALAEGPYHVTWDNVVVRGVPDEASAASAADARLRAFGTGQAEREPRGEWAAISYLASASGRLGPSALFRYRAPTFEVAADEVEWVDITPERVTLLGPARVNGAPGYRFEFVGAPAAGSEPDSVRLQVWGPLQATRPYFEAFGSLAEGSIELSPVEGDPAER